MLRIGLTGGIASGKSVVGAMLRDLGFAVIDADALVHKLQEPGEAAYGEIVGEFGSGILDPAGKIDRAKLGAIVFADSAKLARLNAILHPRVEQLSSQQFAEWERQGLDAGFVEAALLVEAGMHRRLDGVVVVWCRPEQQLERMKARGMSEQEAERRLAAQMPVETKLRYATQQIDTSGSLEQSRLQVQALAAKLRRGASKANEK